MIRIFKFLNKFSVPSLLWFTICFCSSPRAGRSKGTNRLHCQNRCNRKSRNSGIGGVGFFSSEITCGSISTQFQFQSLFFLTLFLLLIFLIYFFNYGVVILIYLAISVGVVVSILLGASSDLEGPRPALQRGHERFLFLLRHEIADEGEPPPPPPPRRGRRVRSELKWKKKELRRRRKDLELV